MAQALNVCLGAAVAVLFWTCLGLPVARRLMPPPLALASAPALGWAAHSVVALPVLSFVGFSTATVLSFSAVSIAVALLALRGTGRSEGGGLPVWLYLAAAIVALAPAAAILPKVDADGVAFAAPIFDHSKVAIISEMTRLGVPPGNPFFGPAGEGAATLAYYYLWHFSAAQLALATGISGWEADAAMTWFTAFFTLMLMVGFASWLAGRSAAGAFVLLLAIAGSLRPLLAALFGADRVAAVMRTGTGFGGWYFQVAWSPQNVAAAGLVVLAIFLLGRLSRAARAARDRHACTGAGGGIRELDLAGRHRAADGRGGDRSAAVVPDTAIGARRIRALVGGGGRPRARAGAAVIARATGCDGLARRRRTDRARAFPGSG